MSGKKALLAGAIFLSSIVAYNCGGGGGATTTSSTLDVYFTDAPGYVSFTMTVYSVQVCETQDPATCQTVFSSSTGTVIDLADLTNTLRYIDTSTVPPGTYQYIRLEVGNSGSYIEIDNTTGTTTSGQYSGITSSDPNISVNCSPDTNTCTIDIALSQPFTPPAKLVIDFQLNNFTVDPTTGEVNIAVSVNPTDPQTFANQYQNRYRFELYAIVESVNQDGTLQLRWGDKLFNATIDPNAKCEDDTTDYEGSCSGMSLTPGDCVEVEVTGDPATLSDITIRELEKKHSHKCEGGYYDYSSDEYENEMYGWLISYDVTLGTISLDLNNDGEADITLTIDTDNSDGSYTKCEYETATGEYEGVCNETALGVMNGKLVKVELKLIPPSISGDSYTIYVDSIEYEEEYDETSYNETVS